LYVDTTHVVCKESSSVDSCDVHNAYYLVDVGISTFKHLRVRTWMACEVEVNFDIVVYATCSEAPFTYTNNSTRTAH